MKNKIIKVLPLVLLVLGFFFMGFKGEDGKNNKIKKVNANDDYKFIAVNQILMWLSNNGDGSHDPRTDGNGFYWPGGINAVKSAVFEDGLIFGAKVGREIRVNGNTHRQGLQAGKILDGGIPDDPGQEKYRVFKIRKDWASMPPGPEKDAREKDYNEWPIEDGAPYVDVDGDGMPTPGVDLPQFIGDEVLWYVANDMDEQRSTNTYGTLPMGLEFQTTIFGFNRTGALGDMVFKKYKIINKGNTTLRDMIVAYWSDTDLGDAGDDFTGSDTSLSLGYTWNSDNADGNGSGATYGTPPPAMGYDFFQGPIVPSPGDSAKFLGGYRQGFRNLPMTAFALYVNTANLPWRDPQQGVPEGSVEFYNYMQGLVWDGSEFINPKTQQATRFVLTGDPESGTGWYEGPGGWPSGPPGGDRRHVMASGPFTMAPGDTQEVVVGLLIAVGANNRNSVTALKLKDRAAQIAYDLDFNLTPSPPAPNLHAVPSDRQITLWWETNAETYNEFDPLLTDTISLDVNGRQFVFPVNDKTYTFEGYQLWQFRDEAGTDPVLIATYDIQNGIDEIRNFLYDTLSVNGSVLPVEPFISGPDLGLQRQITINQDAYTNGPLFNGNPYYFAVTAYGYSKYSDPPVLASAPAIQVVMPGKQAIDQDYMSYVNSNVFLEQTSGNSDAIVRFKVIDPDKLTGHKYAIEFYGPDTELKYRLINRTTGDTMLTDQTRFVSFIQDPVTKDYYTPQNDTVGNVIIDGFMPLIQNIGSDSIRVEAGINYKVKGVYEMRGPGGVEIQNPTNLLASRNSTGAYTLRAGGSKKNLVFQDKALQGLAYKDYDITFTGTSKFYPSGRFRTFPPVVIKNDTLSPGTVPFMVHDIGRNPLSADDDKRLVVKILDDDPIDTNVVTIPDREWSRLPDGTWEQIFAYNPPAAYTAENPNPTSGTLNANQFPFGHLIIDGERPADGTVIRIVSFKPITNGDVFEGTPVPPPASNTELAKTNLNQISVFPNPYFGANSLERDKYQRFMRFTNLPNDVTVRIFTLSGVFVQRLDKTDDSQYLDWDLRNKDGIPVASGIYLAYLDIPNVGSRVMKLAVIMETQFIDRL